MASRGEGVGPASACSWAAHQRVMASCRATSPTLSCVIKRSRISRLRLPCCTQYSGWASMWVFRTGSTLRSPAWACCRSVISSSRGGALAPGAAVITVASFGVEQGLEKERLLRPPALDLDVDGRLVGQGLAPGVSLGLPLLPLQHLDMIQGFRARAGAEVLPDDAPLVFPT